MKLVVKDRSRQTCLSYDARVLQSVRYKSSSSGKINQFNSKIYSDRKKFWDFGE